MDDFTFSSDQIPAIMTLVIAAFEAGKGYKESEMNQKIANSDDLWSSFLKHAKADDDIDG